MFIIGFCFNYTCFIEVTGNAIWFSLCVIDFAFQISIWIIFTNHAFWFSFLEYRFAFHYPVIVIRLYAVNQHIILVIGTLNFFSSLIKYFNGTMTHAINVNQFTSRLARFVILGKLP